MEQLCNMDMYSSTVSVRAIFWCAISVMGLLCIMIFLHMHLPTTPINIIVPYHLPMNSL